MSTNLTQRRSIRNGHHLVRLPSKPGEQLLQDGSSCPNSPAVKKVYRLVVVGSARTGKSALVARFLDHDFEERYIPTIENFHRKLYKIKGDLYQLDILDCSGNDPFPAARKLSYISGDMFIIVGSVDLAQSVDEMFELRNQILDCKSSRGSASPIDVPIVFVLNKTDLPQTRWQVDLDEVTARVKEEAGGLENFIEASAADNKNIDKMFGRVFTQCKCPKHMNPELHRMLRSELSADGAAESDSGVSKRRHLLQRMRSKFSKDGDEEIVSYTDVNARRPSLRTDLLMNRAKTSIIGHPTLSKTPSPPAVTTNGHSKCSIQ